jgi:hypothetical protein
LDGLIKVLTTDDVRTDTSKSEAVLHAFGERLKSIVKGEAISDSTMF